MDRPGPSEGGFSQASLDRVNRARGSGGAALTIPLSFPLVSVAGSDASGPDPQLAVTMGFTGFGE